MQTYVTLLAAAAMTLTLGCSEQKAPGEPGMAEKTGKQVDQAMEKAGQQTQAALDKAGEKTQAALEKAEGYTREKMKAAGQAIERAGEEPKK